MMRALAICAALVLAQGGMVRASDPAACDNGPEPPCLIALAEAELTAATRPGHDMPALRMIARLHARTGAVAEAEAALDRVSSDIQRALAQEDLALALARSGHADAALDAAQRIPTPSSRINVLADIGRLGDPALPADRILPLVAAIVQATPEGAARDASLTAEAVAWAHLGRIDAARARLPEVERNQFNWARLRRALAEAEGLAGDPVAAMAGMADLEWVDLAEVVMSMLARRADDDVLAALEIELARIDEPVVALMYRILAAHHLERAGRNDAAAVWLDGARGPVEAGLAGPDTEIYRVGLAEVALRLGRAEDARAIVAPVADPYVSQVAEALIAAHTLSPPEALDFIRALSDAQARLDGLVTLAGQSILD
jgi:hypothetical protein